MIVGTAAIDFFLHDSSSLKSRRRVARSIKDRVRARFNVSVAEVGDMDHWQRLTLGFALVGNELAFVQSHLDKLIGFVESLQLAEMLDHRIEIY